MVLVTDANVLIDLCCTGGLHVLPKIGPTEVLDVVLKESIDHKPELLKQVNMEGINVISVEYDWLDEADSLRTEELSLPDSLNLYYARRCKRILLTNDGPLRIRCEELGVSYHGTLWLMEQMFEQNLIESHELCSWFPIFIKYNRRCLPPKQTEQLKQKIGC